MGLPKVALERNCPELDEKTASENRGLHSVTDFVNILKAKPIEKNMADLEAILEAEHKDPEERRRFMQTLLNNPVFGVLEAEAIRRVYRKHYGESPKGGTNRKC